MSERIYRTAGSVGAAVTLAALLFERAVQRLSVLPEFAKMP